MVSVTFGCAQCGKAVETAPGTSVVCGNCGATAELPPHDGGPLERCLVCECEELYRHRDFNQLLGLLIIGIGAALWVYTGSFLPMLGSAAIDLFLFYRLPDVAICYRCKAHHRGFANIGQLDAFDLERHEHYRWEKHNEQKSQAD